MGQILDTSKELYIHRYKGGIRLMPSMKMGMSKFSNSIAYTGYTVEKMLGLPMCVHFSSIDGVNQSLNDLTAEASGYDSKNEAIGRSLFAVLKNDSASKVTQADNEVIKTKNLKIIEDTLFRKDDLSIHTLSFKLPWYNMNDSIIGVFGCTIVMGKQRLDESLKLISTMGFLNKECHQIQLFGSEIDDIYLSRRETECLHLTVRGKSAKQVAYEMKISQRTVEEHLTNIKNKMGVFSKAELIDKTIDYFLKSNNPILN